MKPLYILPEGQTAKIETIPIRRNRFTEIKSAKRHDHGIYTQKGGGKKSLII